MTNEERDIITKFIERVGGATTGSNGAALPAVDRDADALIGDLLTRYPGARYRITQLAFVQEHALAEAQNRINKLQYDLAQAQRASQAPAPATPSPWQAPTAPAPAPSRGLFGSLFGGSQPQAAPPPQQYQQPQPQYQQQPPPQQQYAQNYQPGMFQQRGSGFLGSALTTAAGVAGGMVAGNALMSLFEGHGGGGGGGFGGGGFGGGGFAGGAPETVVYEEVAAPPQDASPWSDAPPPPPGNDQWSGGGGSPDAGGWNQPDPGQFDQAQDTSGGSWDSGDQGSSYDDSSA